LIAKFRCCCGCSRNAFEATARSATRRGKAPLGYAEPADETTVEYDEDVLAELDRHDDFA
jgi:hypothetical protein